MKNKHIGSSFDEFLEEEGLLGECTESAIKEVIAYQINEMMAKNQLSKTAMAGKTPSILS